MGAGLATAMGSVFSLLIMLTHFCSKKNTLRLEKPENLFAMLKAISTTGFSTFFIDVAMGILTMLFNRQILNYLGTDALAVYGIIINISTFVQCCAYSIGQASQPLISTNFGACKGERIRQLLRYAAGTAVVFGLIWTALAECVPNLFVRIFMTPTREIIAIAPNIIRSYGISFLPWQAQMRSGFPCRLRSWSLRSMQQFKWRGVQSKCRPEEQKRAMPSESCVLCNKKEKRKNPLGTDKLPQGVFLARRRGGAPMQRLLLRLRQ